MVILLGAILGACIGLWVAYKRKGSKADLLHYGFIYCMMFAVIGLFASLILQRMVL